MTTEESTCHGSFSNKRICPAIFLPASNTLSSATLFSPPVIFIVCLKAFFHDLVTPLQILRGFTPCTVVAADKAYPSSATIQF